MLVGMRKTADLVFDLDGTISDPLTGIHRSINFALNFHALDQVPEATVGGLIGPPLDEAFRALVPAADDRLIGALISRYRERYAEVGFAENSIYDGVREALRNLSDRGLTLGVCTSKREDFAERILEMFGIRSHFSFVDGGDVAIKKRQQLEALLSAGLVDRSTRMIGDRAVDILAASTNGLLSVGVLWGYGSESELREAGANVLLSEARELSQLSSAT